MKNYCIKRLLEVPTGHICIMDGDRGQLEFLSIGDYGKSVNLKCEALGLKDDIEKVNHTKLLPLEEKWVITISTQYGCSMQCRFCDVPKVGRGINATEDDLIGQVKIGISLHPEVKQTNRLNLHYARMGEPTWNPNVLTASKKIRKLMRDINFEFHPVVSTMMPKNNRWLQVFIQSWMAFKNNDMDGEAGLQLSINSTDEDERAFMFSDNALRLPQIADVMSGVKPRGRKITLNFAVAGYEIEGSELLKYFDPEDYIIKLTPMHKTDEAIKNSIETDGDYTTMAPYEHIESDLKENGYDVLVFIASKEEDEGLITCGNAILSGKMPTVEYKEIRI